LHPAQQRIKDGAARFNVLACGRRFGKTTMIVDLLAETSISGYPACYFAPTYKMMSEVWREMSTTLRPIASRVSAQERRIELITGGVVDMWSLDTPNAARGRKYKRVAVDEAGMVKDLQTAWEQVIRPTLADYEGDAWFPGTPKGRNFFHTMFRWGQDETRPDWRSWQLPTIANPHIKPSEIEAMRREMPERSFAQEIEATFLEDGGAVFRKVRTQATATPQASRHHAHTYVFGVDWARSNDYTVISVIDATMNELCFMDRFTQIDYEVQLMRLKSLAHAFEPSVIWAESNSMGGPLVERLQSEGLPVVQFNTTNSTKNVAITALALAFERGDLRILNDEVLINELEGYEQEVLPISGAVRYGAPEGQHDDCVMSLAIAWQGISGATWGTV
jgi:phage terminase large subunit-like protein